jgi:hypothetical protein
MLHYLDQSEALLSCETTFVLMLEKLPLRSGVRHAQPERVSLDHIHKANVAGMRKNMVNQIIAQ